MICYNCFKEKLNKEGPCEHCGYEVHGESGEHYYLPEGTILNNRYTIGRVLGHGGFGITYIGHDEQLQILVAIKEYLPTDVASRAIGEVTVTTFSGEKKEQYEYGLTRFLDEARTLARYNDHPCIVSTTDFFETNNTAYLVMEYLDGIPLNEYLKRKGGKISWDETLEIMMPIMDALKEVHKSGMIHRDISPDNIYITKKGQVKLLDFGAARFALGEKSKSLSVVLKPGYAPPEQYYSRGKQGPWTDVYAVAATMYRMVAGKNLLEAVERMVDQEIDRPEGMTVVAFEVMGIALQVKTEDRYQNIQDMQMLLVDKENHSCSGVTKADDNLEVSLVEPKYSSKELFNLSNQYAKKDNQNHKKTLRWPIVIGAIILLFVIVASNDYFWSSRDPSDETIEASNSENASSFQTKDITEDIVPSNIDGIDENNIPSEITNTQVMETFDEMYDYLLDDLSSESIDMLNDIYNNYGIEVRFDGLEVGVVQSITDLDKSLYDESILITYEFLSLFGSDDITREIISNSLHQVHNVSDIDNGSRTCLGISVNNRIFVNYSVVETYRNLLPIYCDRSASLIINNYNLNTVEFASYTTFDYDCDITDSGETLKAIIKSEKDYSNAEEYLNKFTEYGFVSPSGTSDPHDDMCTYFTDLFTGDAYFWSKYDSYEIIRSKANVLISLLENINPNWNMNYFVELRDSDI